MHATGGYTIADLMEVFSVGRATSTGPELRRHQYTRPRRPGPSPGTPA
jgi:hypothetical protein